MVSETECPPRTAETFSREEERKVAINFPRKKEKLEHRLKRRCDFEACFKKGKKAFSKELGMYFTEQKKGVAKIGVSVGKKHGNAVTRNRIKRLLRAAYFPLIKNIGKPCHIVFVPKVSETYDYQSFKKAVGYLLKKADLLDENPE